MTISRQPGRQYIRCDNIRFKTLSLHFLKDAKCSNKITLKAVPIDVFHHLYCILHFHQLTQSIKHNVVGHPIKKHPGFLQILKLVHHLQSHPHLPKQRRM
ncbi:hypothetical protein JHK82_051662 [Glycine max]|uniref:Uncharacterized protein n=1 Tax=Glycine max TaxID=3847 RepID=A0A0R0FG70_SOYBN|nr:hypothetical protein JHK86_051499 [Glycine max]KAG4937445.1 hypothetical protein JHK85_052364 [Glycine max]KAG5092884.1 hypothetical protein JHK82_051662 [Glycine max]